MVRIIQFAGILGRCVQRPYQLDEYVSRFHLSVYSVPLRQGDEEHSDGGGG